ncbi:MAG: SRPBCC domain-containing protein [Bacteroidota bacterium]|nr:SRPBCC domain-containing protein [Bacteroidota bacterium]
MSNQAIIIEKIFDASVQKVWDALTENAQMKQWYFNLAEFKAEAGFEFQFYGGKPEGKQYLHVCKVTEVIKGKKLTYSWRYDGYIGNSLVTFELIEEGEKTKLKLTHTGIETFDSSVPDFASENFAEGWTYIVNIALFNYLKGEKA